MEKEALRTAMKDSISDVLEKMFFLPLEFSDMVTPKELGADEMLVSTLSFAGPFSGRFFFFVPKRYAVSFAANFLGEKDENISQDQASETVKEAINMLAGTTFFHYDDQAVFRLDIPDLVEPSELRDDPSNSEHNIFIGIETLETRLGLQLIISP
jgi:CheY-specific phosphatase CheX